MIEALHNFKKLRNISTVQRKKLIQPSSTVGGVCVYSFIIKSRCFLSINYKIPIMKSVRFCYLIIAKAFVCLFRFYALAVRQIAVKFDMNAFCDKRIYCGYKKRIFFNPENIFEHRKCYVTAPKVSSPVACRSFLF